MTLSIDKQKLDNLAGEIWKSAERLRGKFKTYEYQSVILPMIVLRRLECVLLAWREAKRPKLTEKELVKLVKDLELNPKNRHKRKENERFKSFSYDDLLKRDKVNLDIFWLKDESLEDSANLPDPDVIAAEIVEDLEVAVEQFAAIAEDLKR